MMKNWHNISVIVLVLNVFICSLLIKYINLAENVIKIQMKLRACDKSQKIFHLNSKMLNFVFN